MRIVIPEPKIDIGEDDFTAEKDGMPLDLVGRQEFGEKLSNLVDRIEDPAVIALDGDWGTGKSVFLKLWAGAHTKQFGKKGKVIYYDAFADDWRDDPLGGLILALEEVVPKDEEKDRITEKINLLKRLVPFLVRPVIRGGLAALTGGLSEFIGAEGLSNRLEEATQASLKATADDLEKMVNEYFFSEENRKVKLQEFRKVLKEIASETRSDDDGNGAGLIFIIDELDRCRPDFALSLLEISKHLFNVNGVIFILGTNLSSLGCMVSSRYGGEIDGEMYLKRFINLKFSLPRFSVRRRAGAFGGALGEKIPASLSYFDEISAKMGLFKDSSSLRNKAISEAFFHLLNDRISLRDVDRFLERVSVFGDSADIIDFFIMCVIFFSESKNKKAYESIVAKKSILSEPVKTFLFSGARGDNNYYLLLFSIWLYLMGDVDNENVRYFVLGKTRYMAPQHINQESIIYDYFDISPL